MGVWGQFKALIWKNYVLRKRHPVYLGLETLWPVLIFVVLALMRLGFPPDHRDTCQFQSRSLPSAGMVPFLQDSICLLENNCSNQDWRDQRDTAQASFRALVQGVTPILERDSTVEAFRALPKLNEILKAVKNFANKTDLEELDKKLKLKNMFKDPSKVVDIIAVKYNIMSVRMTEYVLESTLNPVSVLDKIGNLDFKDTVCDPTKLTKYLIVYPKVNKYTLSTQLCKIDDSLISNITNELLGQLDIGNLIRLGQDLMEVSGMVDYSQLIGDVAALVERYMDEGSLFSVLSDIPDLTAIPGAMRVLADILPSLMDLTSVNFENFQQLYQMLYEVIQPLMGQLGDASLTTDIDKMLKGVGDILKKIESSGENIFEVLPEMLPGLLDQSELLKNISEMVDFELAGNLVSPELIRLIEIMIGNLTEGDPGKIFYTLGDHVPEIMKKSGLEKWLMDMLQITEIPYDDLFGAYDNAVGSASGTNEMDLDASLDSLEESMRQIMGNDSTNMVIALSNTVMDLVDQNNVFYKDLRSELQYTVINTPEVNVALDSLIEFGPETATDIVTSITNMENVYNVMTGASTMQEVCVSVLEGVTYTGSPQTGAVCSPGATGAIETVLTGGLMQEQESKMVALMNQMDTIMSGDIPMQYENSTMKSMYARASSMVEDMITPLTNNLDGWYTLFQNSPNMLIAIQDNSVWTNAWIDMETEFTYNERIMLSVQMALKSMEASSMWGYVTPGMDVAMATVNTLVDRLKHMQALEANDMTISNMAAYYPYLPQILTSAVGTDISRVSELTSYLNDTGKLVAMVCRETDWFGMNLTGYVNRTELRDYFCTLDIDGLASDLTTMFDMTGFINKVTEMLNGTQTTGIDWTRIATDMQFLYGTVSGGNNVGDLFWKLLNIDINMITSYSDVFEGLLNNMMMDNMMESMSAAGDDLASMFENIDTALKEVPIWNRVKHYIATWTSFAEFMIEYSHFIDDGNFTIGEYAKQISPTMGGYLSDATFTVPDLLKNIEDSLKNPQQMIERILGADYSGLCVKSGSLLDILGVAPTPEFVAWEQGLCALNWTQVLQELEDSNSKVSAFMSQFDLILTSSTNELPMITMMNWTAVIKISEEFFRIADSSLFTDSMLDFPDLGIDRFNQSGVNLIDALQNTWALDLTKVSSGIDQLIKLLYGTDMGKDSVFTMFQYTIAQQSFFNYRFVTFANYHLDIINRTSVFDVRAHVENSPELDRLLSFLERSTDVNAVLLDTFKLALENNTQMFKLVSMNVTSVCEDPASVDWISIPSNVNMTQREIVEAVCSAIDINKIFDEILSGFHGLQELVDDLMNATNLTIDDMTVNNTDLVRANERISSLIADLTMKPIMLGTSWDPEADINRLMEQFLNFTLEMAEQNQQTPPGDAMGQTDPTAVRVLATMDLVLDYLVERMQQLTGDVTIEGITNNSTDIVQLFEALENLKKAADNDGADFESSVDFPKVMEALSNTSLLRDHCESATLATYISVGGVVSTVTEALQEVMCINIDMLESVLNDQTQMKRFEEELTRIWDMNSEVTFNQTSLNKNMEEFIRLFVDWAQSPPSVGSQFTEWASWSAVLNFLENSYTDPKLYLLLAGVYNPVLANTDLASMTDTISALINPIIKELQDSSLEDLMSNPDRLVRLVQDIMRADEFITLVTELETPRETILINFICNMTAVEEKMAAMNLTFHTTLVEKLCMYGYQEWDELLSGYYPNQQDMDKINHMFDEIVSEHQVDVRADMFAIIQEVVDSLDGVDLSSVLNTTIEDALKKSQEQSYDNLMRLLKIMEGSDDFVTIQQVFHTLVTVQEHINMLLGRVSGDASMPLLSALPSSDAVSHLISKLNSAAASEFFMVASVYPEQFYDLVMTGTWKDTVCNVSKFDATFTFTAEVDSVHLQQLLCDTAVEDETFMREILDSVEIDSLINKINEIYSSEGNITRALWDRMGELVEQLVERVTGLENANVTGMDAWVETVIKALERLNAEQQVSVEDACTTTLSSLGNMDFYKDYVLPYLNSAGTFIEISDAFMSLQVDIDSKVCDGKKRNITDIITLMSDSGVSKKLGKVLGLITGDNEDEQEDFNCVKLTGYYTFVERLISNLTAAFEGSSNIVECVGDIFTAAEDLLEDTNKLFRASSQLTTLLGNEDLKKFLQDMAVTPEVADLINSALELFRQQEQAVSNLEKLLQKNVSATEAVFKEIYSLAMEAVMPFFDELLGEAVGNMTAGEVIDRFCAQGGQLVPMLNVSVAELSEALCGNDTAAAKKVASEIIQYAQDLNSLQELALYNSSAFWETVLRDVSSLIGNFEGLATLSNLASSLSNIDIGTLTQDKELIDTLKTFLTDNGPDAILENLKKLLDDFKLLDNSDVSNALLDDIHYLADGIFAFSSLRSMFFSNVVIKDLLKDPAKFEAYLTESLNLDPEVAEAIIDGSISMEILLDFAKTDIGDLVCNSTELARLLSRENDTDFDAAYVSESFCNLDTDTINNMLDELIGQLDIGDLVEELVNSGMADILNEAGVTLEETKEALTAVVNANADLTKMTERFDAFASANSAAFESLAQAQTGEEFDSMSSIMCGTAIPTLPDEFQVGESLTENADLTDKQKEERENLGKLGPTCQSMYDRIIKEQNGPVIWAYLKPLLRGKILYTPNTPIVATILQKANSTFSQLENFTNIAVDWANGSKVLEDLSGQAGKEIKDLFDSKLVRSFMMEIGNIASSDLDNILYTLQDADTSLSTSVSKVATLVSDYVGCIEMNRFIGYESESEMEKAAIRLNRDNELMAGLVFKVSDSGSRKKRQSNTVPPHITYTIRMDLDNVPRTDRITDRMWRPQPEDHFFNEMRYFRGFLQLQDIVDSALISFFAEEWGMDFTPPKVTTQQFPFPCHTLDTFVNTIAGYLLPVMMTVSWIAGIAVAVYNLVYDRERGQEETLNIMGLKCGLNFWAWLLSSMILMAIVAVIDVVILKYGNVFAETNGFIVWLFFIDFAFSTLMLCYFVSAFFTRTSLAILTCLIVYCISYLPFVVLYTLEVDMKFWQKTLACLSSTTAFSYAAQYIARYEEQMVGLQWSNIRDGPFNDDDFSFHWCCIMIIIDAGIYFILGWYVRNVKPGKFGVSAPWYFPLSPSYWCCSLGGGREEAYTPSQSEQNIFSEPVQKTSPVVLSARGLSKTYSDGTRAVTNLNLDIHSGDITTLLGHNGAAKTTTMNMLVGLLEPTNGNVRLLNRPLGEMRGSIGMCSQGNALYEYMTVKEHMQFYSSIKDSYNALSAKDEIRQLLKDVDLYYCRHTLVKNLSGGMQRRLSIALAFVGGSKVVILDEPTSGVDPSGRRAIWNLIIRRKDGVAILLSTHHLDEADIISDQIAVLHEGRLLCHGSPMYLKQHLASGHRIIVTSLSDNPDPVSILSVMKAWIPAAKLQQVSGGDMTFTLPAASSAAFHEMFQDLESKKRELNIESYGISDPQLQEVFLKVCSAADMGHQITPEALRQIDEHVEDIEKGENGDWKHDFGANGSLLGALLTKRFLHYLHNWRLLLSVILLPLLLFLLACGLYMIRPKDNEAEKILISPAMYGPNDYVITRQDSSLLQPVSGMDIMNTFKMEPGMGTTCMQDGALDNLGPGYECVSPDDKSHNKAYPQTSCKCEDNKYSCSQGNGSLAIPEFKTATTQILQDMEGMNITKYILESFDDFIKKRFVDLSRYGGLQFDDAKDDEDKTVLQATIWYNNKGHHSTPAFYNSYSNGILRALSSKAGQLPHQYGITVYNHPFVFGKQRLSEDTLVFHAADIGIALIIMLGFTFIPVGSLLYLVTEYLSREKHMQFIAGSAQRAYKIVHYVFLIFPPYALGSGFLDLIDNQLRTIIYRRFDVEVYQNPFTFDMIGWNLVFMGIEAVLFFIIAVVMDTRCCCWSKPDRNAVKEVAAGDIDADVMQEKQRINHGDCRQDSIVIRNLHKVYLTQKAEVHAVNGLTFGVPASQEVESVMERLQLTVIKSKLVRACSGGMKRKLSLAIALLGNPPVILLDEPTTGMDPKAKRLVWDCLLQAKHQGHAIILTSHSLEECDILCDRIGIMDQHLNVIQMDMPRDSVSVADMFAILEREKATYNIQYYTVSQTTLDTIFVIPFHEFRVFGPLFYQLQVNHNAFRPEPRHTSLLEGLLSLLEAAQLFLELPPPYLTLFFMHIQDSNQLL
ncbi:ABCAC-like protein [Mya arenaria]|uniref:ABCAC-like protein n=1 Tax=Mya arenaria TaxID=6604 RepID=A0ABY7DGH0_MYAAR|nr:ABCAC-like protein [Mya arenaria]